MPHRGRQLATELRFAPFIPPGLVQGGLPADGRAPPPPPVSKCPRTIPLIQGGHRVQQQRSGGVLGHHHPSKPLLQSQPSSCRRGPTPPCIEGKPLPQQLARASRADRPIPRPAREALIQGTTDACELARPVPCTSLPNYTRITASRSLVLQLRWPPTPPGTARGQRSPLGAGGWVK